MKWLIVGASRGIGREFITQLRQSRSCHELFATARDIPAFKSSLNEEQKHLPVTKRIHGFKLDIADAEDVRNAVEAIAKVTDKIDVVVLNAGILKYPNRATEMLDFDLHLRTNTIGPIIFAQQLLAAGVHVNKYVFISSDSGSASRFRAEEDGFAAYAASKAALNQMLRHMAAELKRKHSTTTILAIHPGEVATDMANISLPWEVHGIITARESVVAMLKVIESKKLLDSGSFWTWENEPYPW